MDFVFNKYSTRFLEISKSREQQQHELNRRKKAAPMRMVRSVRNTQLARPNLVVTGSASAFKSLPPATASHERTKSASKPLVDNVTNDNSYEASRNRLNREAYAILKNTSTNIESIKSRINLDRIFELKSATLLPKTPKSQQTEADERRDLDDVEINETSSDEDVSENVIINLAQIRPLTDANLANHNAASVVPTARASPALSRSRSLLDHDRGSATRRTKREDSALEKQHQQQQYHGSAMELDRISVRSASSLSDHSVHQQGEQAKPMSKKFSRFSIIAEDLQTRPGELLQGSHHHQAAAANSHSTHARQPHHQLTASHHVKSTSNDLMSSKASSSSTTSINNLINSRATSSNKYANLLNNSGKRLKFSNPAVRNYFRHHVKIVIALLRLVRYALTRFRPGKEAFQMMQSRESAMAQDPFLSELPKDSDNIVFNKDLYKAKIETEVSKEMQFILTIPPESRTDDQIKFVRNGLQKLTSFAEYPINMQEKICKCAFYQKVPLKRVIIRQGQTADSFYFIVTGKAIVTVIDEKNESKSRFLAVLKHGSSFGELAFLYNSTRTATVSSLTDLELISIGREDFFDIFMSNRGEEPDHIKYLRTCAFMKDWPIQKLLENPKSCLFHFYKRGEVVVKNTNKCDWIYVVKSGTCQVIKRLHGVRPRTLTETKPKFKTNPLTNEEIGPKVDTGLHRRKSLNSSIKPWSFTSGIGSQSEQNHENEMHPVFIMVQLLKAGETFGLNLLQLSQHDELEADPELSLISDGAEVLMLDRAYFLKHLNEKVRINLRKMNQNYPSKEAMQSALQTAVDWESYKQKTMDDLYSNIFRQKARKSSRVFF